MRIAVTCHPTQGGSGIVATELAMSLSRRGHDVHLVSCDRPFRLDEESAVTYHPVNVLDYPLFRHSPHDLSLVNKLVEVTVEHDIDVIHAHYAVPHGISAILAAKVIGPQGSRVVITLHGTDITLVGSHPDFHTLCRYAMENADGLTAVSSWLQKKTLEAFHLSRAPDVIPNFIDIDRFHARRRAPYPDGAPFHILHMSNFRPVKRTQDVVRVFDQIRKAVPARLTLLGEGPALGVARELCAELDCCDLVTFAGAMPDVESQLRSAHLFLLLSDYESFGLSALEALGCGTPVAVSNAGGLPEVVDNGVTGLLCSVGDVKETSEAAIELLKDRKRWEAMSVAAAETARNRFDGAEISAVYEQYYESLLSEENL